MAGPSAVRTTVDGLVLQLSNLEKVLYPAAGFTKAEVISYYLEVAETLLPHLAERVLTRVRFPDGVRPGAPSFYEKNPPLGAPDWVRTQPVLTGDGIVEYLVTDSAATLVWLANLAALELHVPQWRISSATADADGVIELPGDEPRPGEPLADLVVVDLDPGAGVGMVELSRAALLVAQLMAADGLIPEPRTSGGKGLQVYAAVAPSRSESIRSYVKAISRRMHREHPDLFIFAPSVASRAGRVFVDYNQNMAARNTIAAYSLRGREYPTVATPVTWDEVGSVSGPDDLRFLPAQVLDRVATLGDLAVELFSAQRPPLPEELG